MKAKRQALIREIVESQSIQTQEELAEALNISLEHLSKMERGKRKPSIDLIVAMACYFHVSTDYLLMGKDHDKVDSRTKLLDVVAQLAKIAKSL